MPTTQLIQMSEFNFYPRGFNYNRYFKNTGEQKIVISKVFNFYGKLTESDGWIAFSGAEAPATSDCTLTEEEVNGDTHYVDIK